MIGELVDVEKFSLGISLHKLYIGQKQGLTQIKAISRTYCDLYV